MKHWLFPLFASLLLHAAVMLMFPGESLTAPVPPKVLKARLVMLPSVAAFPAAPERQPGTPRPPSGSGPSPKKDLTPRRQEKPATRQAVPPPGQAPGELAGEPGLKDQRALPGAVPRTPEAPAPDSPPAVREVAEPDILTRVPPLYPLASRRKGEAGTVLLLVRIDAGGKVLEVSVRSTSGHPALDRSAVTAVSRWKFRPGAPGLLLVPVVFRLE